MFAVSPRRCIAILVILRAPSFKVLSLLSSSAVNGLSVSIRLPMFSGSVDIVSSPFCIVKFLAVLGSRGGGGGGGDGDDIGDSGGSSGGFSFGDRMGD